MLGQQEDPKLSDFVNYLKQVDSKKRLTIMNQLLSGGNSNQDKPKIDYGNDDSNDCIDI